MTPKDAHSFLTSHQIVVRDPETGSEFARAHYRADGTCQAKFSDGRQSAGRWGATDQGYWTMYDNFRDGARHEFTLQFLAPGRAQAYHGDGRRAFLQEWDDQGT